MGEDTFYRPSRATRDNQSTTDRPGRRGLGNPYTLLGNMLSSKNTPVHVPQTPAWFKLFPFVIIILSLVVMFYGALVNPTDLFVAVLGGLTAVTIIAIVVVRYCVTALYSYYMQLAIDAVFFSLWIAAILVEVLKSARQSNPNPKRKRFDSIADVGPTMNSAPIALAIIEATLFFIHMVFFIYYIYLHRSLGLHSRVIRDREGNLMTKDNPPPGMWEVNSSSQEFAESIPLPSRRQYQDPHALESPLAFDPLRASPVEGTPTRSMDKRPSFHSPLGPGF